MSKPTDLTILRALLDAGRSRLSASEERAFKGMLRDLETGMIVRLSMNQRVWAEQKYNHFQLDRVYKDKPPPAKKVAKPAEKVVYAWEKNLPTKPPGK